MSESTDPYTYPGTNVLRNLHDIQDAETLARFEAEATTRRIVELLRSPVDGRFGTSHLRAIHRHIFQDVYEWAGRFRTINISKGGYLFGAAAFVEGALEDVFHKLAGEKYLRGIEPASFTARAGFYLGEINAAHPFRDGNGRAQREFIRELGLHASFAIDWSRVGREEMIAASRESAAAGDSSELAVLIRSCIR